MAGRISNHFAFTPQELRTLQRRIHTTLRQNLCSHYRQDVQAQRHNNWTIWRVLKAVGTGYPSQMATPSTLEWLYKIARTAYDNARHLGRPESEARRAATVFIQIPLERYLNVGGPALYCSDTKLHQESERYYHLIGSTQPRLLPGWFVSPVFEKSNEDE